MDSELSPRETAPAIPETNEGLPVGPRIVVFGSFGSGAPEVEAALREELAARGLDIEVYQGRLVTGIEANFYARDLTQPVQTAIGAQPAIEAAPQTPASRGRRVWAGLGNLLTRKRDVVAPTQEDTKPDSLPMGVLIFPEMRQRTPDGATAMCVPTPHEKIIGLCEEHGVPYKLAGRIEEARQGIGEIFPQAALGQNEGQ